MPDAKMTAEMACVPGWEVRRPPLAGCRACPWRPMWASGAMAHALSSCAAELLGRVQGEAGVQRRHDVAARPALGPGAQRVGRRPWCCDRGGRGPGQGGQVRGIVTTLRAGGVQAWPSARSVAHRWLAQAGDRGRGAVRAGQRLRAQRRRPARAGPPRVQVPVRAATTTAWDSCSPPSQHEWCEGQHKCGRCRRTRRARRFLEGLKTRLCQFLHQGKEVRARRSCAVTVTGATARSAHRP